MSIYKSIRGFSRRNGALVNGRNSLIQSSEDSTETLHVGKGHWQYQVIPYKIPTAGFHMALEGHG